MVPMFTCGFERSNFALAMVQGALSVGGPIGPIIYSARHLLGYAGKIKPFVAVFERADRMAPFDPAA
jgi:hypothetical protein